MITKLEVTIEIIIHVTEDQKKIFESFENIFGVKKEAFSEELLTGHFENPIILLKIKIKKNQAKEFIKIIVSKTSNEQMKELIEDIELRIQNSSLNLRIEKQELVKGNIIIRENNGIKVKIYTPVYTKKDLVRAYTELLVK